MRKLKVEGLETRELMAADMVATPAAFAEVDVDNREVVEVSDDSAGVYSEVAASYSWIDGA